MKKQNFSRKCASLVIFGFDPAYPFKTEELDHKNQFFQCLIVDASRWHQQQDAYKSRLAYKHEVAQLTWLYLSFVELHPHRHPESGNHDGFSVMSAAVSHKDGVPTRGEFWNFFYCHYRKLVAVKDKDALYRAGGIAFAAGWNKSSITTRIGFLDRIHVFSLVLQKQTDAYIDAQRNRRSSRAEMAGSQQAAGS